MQNFKMHKTDIWKVDIGWTLVLPQMLFSWYDLYYVQFHLLCWFNCIIIKDKGHLRLVSNINEFWFDEGECQTFSWGSLYRIGRGVIDFVISDYRKMSFFAAEIWLMLTSRWKTFLLFVIKYFIFLWIIILFPASNNVTMRTLNDRLLIAASFSRFVLGRTLVKRRKKSAQISFYHLFKVPEWFRH